MAVVGRQKRFVSNVGFVRSCYIKRRTVPTQYESTDWDPPFKTGGIYYSLRKTRDAFLKK